MSRPLTFKSRIDTWVLIAILAVVSIAVLGADAILSTATTLRWLAAAVVVVVGILLPLWVLTYTRYELGDRDLTVHCGPLRWSVPIGEISNVSSTRNAARSPALSTRRLRIDYGQGRSVMISPDDREMFMRSLEARRAELGAGSPASA